MGALGPLAVTYSAVYGVRIGALNTATLASSHVPLVALFPLDVAPDLQAPTKTFVGITFRTRRPGKYFIFKIYTPLYYEYQTMTYTNVY